MPINKWDKREAVGDLGHGLKVKTSEVEADAYWVASPGAAIFTVYGRCLITEIFAEVTEIIVGATTPWFYYVGTTPVTAGLAISAASLTAENMTIGDKLAWPALAVATASVVDISVVGIAPDATGPGQIMGMVTAAGVNSIGTINSAATVAATDGNLVFHCAYVPLSDGAYVEAAI